MKMSEEIKNEQVNEENEVTPKQEVKEEKPQEKEEAYVPQSKVDEIVKKRLERERSKYADYEELKAKLAEYQKAEEERKRAEMSELERLQADLQAKAQAEQTLTQQLAELKAQIEREKVTNAFIKVAPSVGIPSDRIDAAMKLADLSAVKVENGEVVGLEDVMKALVEQYSFLIEKPAKPKPIGDATNSNNDTSEKTAQQMLKEAAEKARRTGRPEDLAAYAKLKRELGL
jgi:hypothetical protein